MSSYDPTHLPPRTPYRLGKLAPKFPAGLRTLDHYVATALPAPPATVPAPNFALGFGMLGNDSYGDCGPAGLQHLLEADAVITSESEQWATAQQVVAYYLAYTGGQDSGVVLSDFLTYVAAKGFLRGHTVSAFAPVDLTDIAMLQNCVDIFGGAYVGIQVTSSMMADCPSGGTWTPWTSATGQVLGGHCVPIIGYDNEYLYLITWGQVQAMSYSCWASVRDEAWGVITGEFAAGDGRGFDLAALQADLPQLNDPSPPGPSPAPTPPSPGSGCNPFGSLLR